MSVHQACPVPPSVVEERSGALSPPGGERGLQRCPSSLSTKAQSVGMYAGHEILSVIKKKNTLQTEHDECVHHCFCTTDTLEGAAGPFSGKDPGQSSPMSDRKKNRRKKSMNQKGDAAVGQAEGEST